MSYNKSRTLVGVLAALALSAFLPLAQTASAEVVRWNVQASRPIFTYQTISGYFDFDTTAGQIVGWSLNADNILSSNSNFTPPPNASLVSCGTSSCYAIVTPGASGGLVGLELGFYNIASPVLLDFVGLGVPVGADLTGSTIQVYNLVGGYPYSIAVAEDQENQLAGYAEFTVNGTMSFGGVVVAGLVGGTTPAAPVSIASGTVGNPQIGQISTQLGGSYSCSQYYRFFTLGGSNWTTTGAILGAAPGTSYTLTLLNSRGTRVIAQVTLDASNNFQSPLIIPSLRPGSYVIGLVGNNPGDPPATISFTNPVTPHQPDDDGAGDE